MNKIKKNPIFGLRVRAIWWEKEKEKNEKRRRKRKKEEEKRGIQVWNTCLDICKETIVRILVWNCLETLVLEILVYVELGKP